MTVHVRTGRSLPLHTLRRLSGEPPTDDSTWMGPLILDDMRPRKPWRAYRYEVQRRTLEDGIATVWDAKHGFASAPSPRELAQRMRRQWRGYASPSVCIYDVGTGRAVWRDPGFVPYAEERL